jgi:hypothetical protein
MAGVTVRGIPQVREVLGLNLKAACSAANKAIGAAIVDKLGQAPGPAAHPIKWASDKQRRFFFAMRRRMLGEEDQRVTVENARTLLTTGKWGRKRMQKGYQIGYTRESDPMSQRLLASWAVEGQAGGGAIVGTKATYAPWVQSAEKQQGMHSATGWVTDEAAVRQVEASGVIERAYSQAISDAINKQAGRIIRKLGF